MAAERELLEETGYEVDELRYLTRSPSSAGMTDETITFFLALNARRVAAGGGDDSEDITVHTIPLTDIDHMVSGSTEIGNTAGSENLHGALLAGT